MSETERMRCVLRDIAEDMKNDAIMFDGKPSTGRTVAEYFSHQGAAIAVLATIIEKLLPTEAEETNRG